MMGERKRLGPVPLRAVLIGLVWLGSLGATFVAGAFSYRHRGQLVALLGRGGSAAVTQTNLYNLTVTTVPIESDGRDGAIEAVSDGLLLIGRLGGTWYVDADRVPRPLELRVPVDFERFRDDPYNAETLEPSLFGVKDVLLQPLGSGYRLLVTHSHWDAERDCNALRVSAIEVTEAELTGAQPVAGAWRTAFETTPCLELERTGERPRLPIGVGGRLAALPDGSVLLSVGGFTPEMELEARVAQDSTSSYGKVLRLDLASGTSTIHSWGHRNPQGLAVGPAGDVWLSEHGARGGDELNELRAGANYGYPMVSYGTQYEQMEWPLSERQGRHEGYDKPIFAWTPGIGISQLVVLENGGFPDWQGDLIIGSLAAQSLFHVRVEEERVMFVEQIPVGHRVRDVAELTDGTLALKTDDDLLIFLAPLTAASADALTPEARGAMVANQCMSCHTFVKGAPSGIGPNLNGVVGRRIGSLDGYEYSDALSSLPGRWTAESLERFIRSPTEFAPGTKMALTGDYTDQEISDLVRYLGSL